MRFVSLTSVAVAAAAVYLLLALSTYGWSVQLPFDVWFSTWDARPYASLAGMQVSHLIAVIAAAIPVSVALLLFRRADALKAAFLTGLVAAAYCLSFPAGTYHGPVWLLRWSGEIDIVKFAVVLPAVTFALRFVIQRIRYQAASVT